MPPAAPATRRPTEVTRTPTRLQSRFTKGPFVGGNDAARPPPGETAVGRAASTATTRAGTPVVVDRGGGPKSISDSDDHAWRSPDTIAQGEVDVKRRGRLVTLLTRLLTVNRAKPPQFSVTSQGDLLQQIGDHFGDRRSLGTGQRHVREYRVSLQRLDHGGDAVVPAHPQVVPLGDVVGQHDPRALPDPGQH